MITAIVLAAGMSTRLGTPKQLLNYRGKSLIRHVVENILKSRVQDILVVVGAKADEVSRALQDLPVTIVVNEDYAEGQSTSIKKGVSTLLERSSLQEEPLSKGVLFALGDQPLLKTETIDELIKEFDSHGGIVVPQYKGQRGNPVIFEQKLIFNLNSLSGDIGARQLINLYKEEVRRVEVKDPGVIFDIDTWEDYQHLSLSDS